MKYCWSYTWYIIGHASIIEVLQSQPKGKVDFESTNGEGKTAYEVAKEVEARAVLHNWLLSLQETPTNLFLQKKKEAAQGQHGNYGSSDDDSDGSEGWRLKHGQQNL